MELRDRVTGLMGRARDELAELVAITSDPPVVGSAAAIRPRAAARLNLLDPTEIATMALAEALFLRSYTKTR